MAKTAHFKGFSIIQDGVKISLSMERFEKQFKEAQYQLDGDVMNSMIPFMPHYNGTFIQNTRKESAAVQGTGKVYAAFGPQGRYLYMGKVMVDSATGKGPSKIETAPGEYILRFRKGAKLVATDRPLRYTRTHNAEAQDHWFDAAKAFDGKKWIEKAKKTAGGG